MRHIKTYEESSYVRIEIGDYVIAEVPINISQRYDSDYVKFLSTHIGIISSVNRSCTYVGIDYDENVPGNGTPTDYTYLDIRCIKHLSKNKEDLEIILSSKKYNL